MSSIEFSIPPTHPTRTHCASEPPNEIKMEGMDASRAANPEMMEYLRQKEEEGTLSKPHPGCIQLTEVHSR
jgi:hypothetical protein